VITAYVKERRWFRAKARGLASATVEEVFPLELAGEPVRFAVVRCTYEDGGYDQYILPMAVAAGDEAARIRKEQPHLVIGTEGAPPGGVVFDALGSERILEGLMERFRNGGSCVESGRGTLVFRPYPPLEAAWPAKLAPKPTRTEQTNTSIVFDSAFILKIVRKLDEGVSAELEMGEFLTRHGYASSPQVVGSIELERAGAAPSTVGVVHRFTKNQGDAWTTTLGQLRAAPSPDAFRGQAELLGRRVGEMHVVLAGGTEGNFAPEPITKPDRVKLAAAVEEQARQLAKSLRDGDDARIGKRLQTFVDLGEDPLRMRVHGDLHLGQILAVGPAGAPPEDFVLIDFEGEPARSLAERKGKRSPLADVAGMLRSFDYAAATVLRERSVDEARAWYRAVAKAFLGAYRTAARASHVLAASDDVFEPCLDFYLLEKCLYEIAYEANNRPDWIAIPRAGLQDILDS
jgi:maltose alpha-D-glucosyltransferase/alpha-amylase